MKSMTGFGSSLQSTKKLEVNVSMKAVNGRFLDIKFHLPREYAQFESEIKKKISRQIRRGTVDVYIHRRHGEDSSHMQVKTRVALAKKWMKAHQDLARHLKLEDTTSLKSIAQLPGVLLLEEASKVASTEKKLLMVQVEKALRLCEQERKREGLALKKELQNQLRQLTLCSQKMGRFSEAANKKIESKLHARLKKLGLQGEVDAQRLAQEITMLVDRADIAEELQRLAEHIRGCRQQILGPGVHGKKLDFYCQELLREVNTVGSKSQVTELTHEVVNAKSIIERFREQVQNVE